jgi:hypothetical protein
MEREHLIIIALIFIALCMMNKDTKDTVMSMGPIGPMGRIRYADAPENLTYEQATSPGEGFAMPNRVRYSDKHFASSQHIKNHIRNRNMNSMFSGMMGTGYEPFRMEGGAGWDQGSSQGYP